MANVAGRGLRSAKKGERPGGRPPGSQNRFTRELKEELFGAADDVGANMPLMPTPFHTAWANCVVLAFQQIGNPGYPDLQKRLAKMGNYATHRWEKRQSAFQDGRSS
jgi:hypothetical protein